MCFHHLSYVKLPLPRLLILLWVLPVVCEVMRFFFPSYLVSKQVLHCEHSSVFMETFSVRVHVFKSFIELVEVFLQKFLLNPLLWIFLRVLFISSCSSLFSCLSFTYELLFQFPHVFIRQFPWTTTWSWSMPPSSTSRWKLFAISTTTFSISATS